MYLNAIEHKIVRFRLLSLLSFFLSFSLCLSPSLKTAEPTTKNPRSNGFAKMPLPPLLPHLFSATDLYGGWLVRRSENTDSARNFAKKLRKAKEDRVERRGKKEGKEDFRRDLSYRKTHRAVHSVSAFISFSRICRVIGFHLYTWCTLIFPTCTDFYPISKKRRTLISSFFLPFLSLSLCPEIFVSSCTFWVGNTA